MIVKGPVNAVVQRALEAEKTAEQYGCTISWHSKRAKEWRGVARPVKRKIPKVMRALRVRSGLRSA
ncbi:MAG TPA: hypothetical protein VGG39_14570 [Polyangiaceae bacterium]